MEEKLEKLLKDPTFLAELDAAETLEDISAVLSRYDIQVVPEDLQKAKEAMEADTELNEGDLDGVSGGCGSVWAMALMTTMLIISLYKCRKAQNAKRETERVSR